MYRQSIITGKINEDFQKIWVEENIRIDNSGLYSLYIYFDKYFYFIPLMLFLFLLGAGFANEKGKKKTLQLLKTQPVAEKKIFLGKGIYASTTALVSSVGLFLSSSLSQQSSIVLAIGIIRFYAMTVDDSCKRLILSMTASERLKVLGIL